MTWKYLIRHWHIFKRTRVSSIFTRAGARHDLVPILSSPSPFTIMPAIRGADSKKKTRRHTRDLDQIHVDLRSEKHLAQYKHTKVVEELPGLGRFYCTECAKWFESDTNFEGHKRGKNHKRRYAGTPDVALLRERQRLIGRN